MNSIAHKLKELEGNTFHSVTKIPFTYKMISDNAIQIDGRKPHPLSLANFEKALKIDPKKPSDLKNVRGSSYVFAIITDKRFTS